MAVGDVGVAEVVAATYAARPGDLDPAIPGPTGVLGPWVLQRPASCAEIWAYVDALAAVSPLVQVHDYGTTWAGRRLAYVTVSGRSQDASSDQATVWVGAGIHGDEPSGADAAMMAMYRLAAGTDSETCELRDRLVVHIDPVANPDGRERYLAGTTAFAARQPSLDYDDLASVGPWPTGRGNHYLFDLNRDLILQTQPETRARVAAMRHVDPHLVLELHEMEHHDSFLFASPGEPLNPHLPEHVSVWWERLAKTHGTCLDGMGVAWYRGEWNEVFYPGYQDIWPAYSGAVPVIFEQGRTGPTAVRLDDGRIRTYAEAVRNQVASIFANLRAATEGSAQLRGDALGARRPERSESGGYVVPISVANQQRARWLADCLSMQGIETLLLRERPAPHPPTSLVIPLNQPLAMLARVLLEPEVAVPPAFVAAERGRLERAEKGALYDVTAWSPALAAGLEVELRQDALSSAAAVSLADWSAGTEVVADRSAAAFGYLFHDDGYRMVAAVLNAGLAVRVGVDPVQCDGRSWPAGTSLVRADEQRLGNAAEVLDRLARAHGVPVIAVHSAAVSDGPDLGGRRFVRQRRPSVGILAGTGVDEPSFGSVRHLLDIEAGIPATVLDPRRLTRRGSTDLNVIVVPEVEGIGVHDLVGPSAAAWLGEWMAAGGTLITMGSSAAMIGELSLGETYLERSAARWLPTGAFLNVDVDSRHPMALGMESSFPVHWRGSGVLVPGPSAQVVARHAPAARLARAGLVWDEAVNALAETPYLLVEPVGRGQAVIFGSEPLWRGAARATSRLLVRALATGRGVP